MKKTPILIKKCKFPYQSILSADALNADFSDSYQLISVSNRLDVLDIYILMVNNTPKWINQLLFLRNKIMLLFGLKDVKHLGGLSQTKYENRSNLIGTKLDIFEISTYSRNEMTLILNDKHLDIKMSILNRYDNNSQKNTVIISTLVYFNNFLGRFYMLIITPFHKIVVKRLLSNILIDFSPLRQEVE
ncbi:MAG: DUF2867 domain-containing protein [Proteobacteria bacterium]|nr:DUF2867 domain-containing protein [Pseudomonadota bacterium]